MTFKDEVLISNVRIRSGLGDSQSFAIPFVTFSIQAILVYLKNVDHTYVSAKELRKRVWSLVNENVHICQTLNTKLCLISSNFDGVHCTCVANADSSFSSFESILNKESYWTHFNFTKIPYSTVMTSISTLLTVTLCVCMLKCWTFHILSICSTHLQQAKNSLWIS